MSIFKNRILTLLLGLTVMILGSSIMTGIKAEGLITYQGHVQDIGWMNPVTEGQTCGTTGQAKRLEAIIINADPSLGIEYSAHVQDYGWMDYVSVGNMAGTQGEAKRVEAVKVRLTGDAANTYDVYYRTHVSNYGWLDWTSNDNIAGTTGLATNMEALEIMLVAKGGIAPTPTDNPYIDGSMVQPTPPVVTPTPNTPTVAQPGLVTVKNFLATALLPIGTTNYVYGGGWNEEDTGAGLGATTIGVLPQWQLFFSQQNAFYDYRNTLYQINNGLDCSGYVGWAVYNIMNTTNGGPGEVYLADRQAQVYANKGYGFYTPYGQAAQYFPGDVVSMNQDAHVYIVIGQCADGSIVIAHASPPGVMLSGTTGPNGEQTEATILAKTYMQRYYPEYYARYSTKIDRGFFYRVRTSKMTWDLGWDPDLIRAQDAAGVLRILFNE